MSAAKGVIKYFLITALLGLMLAIVIYIKSVIYEQLASYNPYALTMDIFQWSLTAMIFIALIATGIRIASDSPNTGGGWRGY